MRAHIFCALATAGALSTNNLRDARFSCSIVGDSLLAGLVAGGEGGFEPVAKVVVNELRKLILTPPFTADATQWFSIVDLPQRIEATRSAVNDNIRDAAPVLLDLAADCENDASTYMQPDGIHFTRAGYRALGLRVAETLEEALLGKAPPRTAIYPGSKKPPPVRS